MVHNFALARESLTLLHAKIKGTDQPAHARSLVSAFVIRSIESIIANLATFNISILQLVYAAKSGLSLTLL